MFLWEPSKSNKPIQRMTGHVQLINQVRIGRVSSLNQEVLVLRKIYQSGSHDHHILAIRPKSR